MSCWVVGLIIVAAVLLIPLVPAFLIWVFWTKTKLNQNAKITLTVVLGILQILILVGVFNTDNNKDSEAKNIQVPKTTSSTQTKVITQTPEPTKTEEKTTVPTTVSEPTKIEAPSNEYSCAKKTCSQISSCSEAMYLLNDCGMSALDRDKDGIPCETLCK